jgi:hypothetical protein
MNVRFAYVWVPSIVLAVLSIGYGLLIAGDVLMGFVGATLVIATAFLSEISRTLRLIRTNGGLDEDTWGGQD